MCTLRVHIKATHFGIEVINSKDDFSFIVTRALTYDITIMTYLTVEIYGLIWEICFA